MKLCKAIPVFILLLEGCLCSTLEPSPTSHFSPVTEKQDSLSPLLKDNHNSTSIGLGRQVTDNANETGRSLPALVVAGVSIALVLLFILIVTIFWYAQKKSQEGSIEFYPVPYSEPGVSLRTISVPENQQEWPFERARQ